MTKLSKIILRIIALPFVTAIILISYITFALGRSFDFLRYGGEFNSYSKNETATIQDIYNELKNKRI